MTFADDEILTLWGGNYGRVEVFNYVTGAAKLAFQFFSQIFRTIFSDQQFSENKWTTMFFNYQGVDLDTFNPITNQLFMVLREVRPIWLEEVVIARVDLNTHGSMSSAYIDTTYFTYSNLQIYYKV